MDEGLTQLIEHLPLLSGVITIVLTGIGLFWKLATVLFQQHRGYLEEKFRDVENIHAESSQHWERRFEQLKEIIERYGEQADALERRIDDFGAQYIDRDRFIHAHQVVDHKIVTLARRMEDCQATICRYVGVKHE